MTPAILETNILLSLIYGMTIYLAAWVAAVLVIKNKSVALSLSPANNRYGSIDGLRGVLAVGVLVHHSSMAYEYFTVGKFQSGPNPLLYHFGKSSVALFFMITGFLFTNIALKNEVNWSSFFKSRIKRLAPLYTLVVSIIFIIVLIIDNFELHVSWQKYVVDYFRWLSFVIFGRPPINGMKDSELLIAGVNWSLKFEVIFYIVVVPIIFIVSKKVSRQSLIIGCIAFGLALVAIKNNMKNGINIIWLLYFLSGITIALLYKSDEVKRYISHKYFCYSAILSLIILLFTNTWWLSYILLCIIFASVVGGGSLFGLLKMRASIWLGDISYGIYLLHGLVLYAFLSLLKDKHLVHHIDIRLYWVIVLLIAVIVVMLSSISYVFLEKPIMNSGKKLPSTIIKGRLTASKDT